LEQVYKPLLISPKGRKRVIIKYNINKNSHFILLLGKGLGEDKKQL